MTHLLGLTGSIGMGKTTTAKMFANMGVPVWDADDSVHNLYAPGGAAVEAIKDLYPEAIVAGAVSREVLSSLIAKNTEVLDRLEAIVHPMVSTDRQRFIAENPDPLLVFDIPLLFETHADRWLDSVLVVSTDPATQKERVLNRPGMSEEKFNSILERQMSDAEKRAKADHLIETSSIDATRVAVARLIDEILRTKDA